MKYPKFLKENGTIGVCAPSFGCKGQPYESRQDSAIKKFNELNHKVVFSNSVYGFKRKMASNTPRIRAQEFIDMYENKDVDVIISQAGGEIMCQILPYIDFNYLSSLEPKWFQGFSDNTCLTFLLTILSDVATIYGNCFSEYGMNKWHSSIKDSYDILSGKLLKVHNLNKYEIESKKRIPGKELCGYNLTEKVEWKNLSKEDKFEIEGRVLSGCLDVLILICGTQFDKVKEFLEKYKEDGFIWFVESCDLNIASQLRAFWQLKNAGWFKYCKGIIIGRPNNKEVYFDMDYKEANYKELRELHVPVIIDADFGHVAPRVSIINGAIANIKYDKGKCKIEYKLR